ncbi:MAG: glycerol-3-phosphate 1-O-acyltransferase PlsY [Verrucomicrobiota bacterium]
MIPALSLLLLGYLVGSIPFGYLAGRLKGLDIREHGSGNIGATNALRVLGKPVGYTVLLLDAIKGVVPAVIARQWIGGEDAFGEWIPLLTGILTIVGHNFTCFLGFQGGKGIATSAGVLGALLPLELAIGLSLWIVLVFTIRYVSVASIAAAGSLPVTNALASLGGEFRLPYFLATAALCLMAFLRHLPNLQRLRQGTEPKVFSKRKDPAPESDSSSPHHG